MSWLKLLTSRAANELNRAELARVHPYDWCTGSTYIQIQAAGEKYPRRRLARIIRMVCLNRVERCNFEGVLVGPVKLMMVLS